MSANEITASYLAKRKDWETHSAVRNSPERYELNLSGNYLDTSFEWHIPSYSAILSHPDCTELSASDRQFVMGLQMIEFLMKTEIFEVKYVNTVASDIALRSYDYEISSELVLDAHRIYVDEAYHGFFSRKVLDQISNYYAIKENLKPYVSGFFNQVERIGGNKKEWKSLALLGVVIVSENVILNDISGEMKSVIHPPIVQMYKNHMIDEAFHAKFFSAYFKSIWSQLPISEQRYLGKCMLDSITLLGAPRTDIYYYSFGKLGFSESKIARMIADIYEADDWKIEFVKKKMRVALNLMEQVGVFDINEIREAAINRGYLAR